MTKYLQYILALLMVTLLNNSAQMWALPKDYHASESVLSSGSWAKVEVTESGMQLIPVSVLKNLGFTDVSKVNVYGYGGRMLSERLDGSTPDDLPLIPSILTPQGIVFFGHGPVLWERSSAGSQMEYAHTINPYSEHSYYFISDREVERPEAAAAEKKDWRNGELITVFTERLAHEKDQIAPSNTGRILLGEDFRAQTTRQFTFNLPGNTGDAVMKVNFGAKTSSGSASLTFTANGKALAATKNDQFSASSSSKFITVVSTVKEIENPGEKLNLSVSFQNSGAISTAALDYIEIEYPRSLRLSDDELYFYLNPSSSSTVAIEGCSSSTVLWDVTDPVSPKVVETTLSGTTLTFPISAGYSEFIAFNPDKIRNRATSAGKIRNQDLHSLSAPGMLVISPEEYKSAAEELARLHQEYDGLEVKVLTPEEIYNEFSSGNPDVTAFRRLLKMWYDRADENGDYTRYCLIMSRPTYDNKMVTPVVKNAGYPRVPIWQSPTGDTESNSYSTDDYVGMLDDNKASFNIGSSAIHVAVGRMPVKSLSEARSAVSKLRNYLYDSKLSSWRNNVMVIADDQDNGVHLQQAENCINAMRSAGNGSNYLYEKLYLDAYPLVYTAIGASYPGAKERMFEKLAEGVAFVDYIGHANPTTWGHENLLTWTDIMNISNKNLPFIYAATCEFLRWDDDNVSGAELLWLNPTAGVIGMICPSRSVLISANGVLNKATSSYVFSRDNDGNPLRVGDIMVKGKNSSNTDTNKLRYGLIGDPAMYIPSPSLNVEVETINGIDVRTGKDMPVLEARSTADISGVVTDGSGAVVEDFNGVVELQLFDAEKVVTTYGNGDEGVPSVYNDRKTRLYYGRINVKEGRWSATVMMPAEIENNYSPALISLYANDDNGREANGACENFYVYGFNEEAPEDYEGPEIRNFYLNHASFSNGDVVSPSPVLTANIYDISGINVSDAGIGHSMTLALDGKDFYNDVALFYYPDLTDPLGGEIIYPLSNIGAGEHTLTLTVWDNANNSSSASLTFNVSASWTPDISTLTTDVNPASTSVNFIVETDGIDDGMACKIEVFDIAGRNIWSSSSPATGNTKTVMGWDLCDGSGARVARGIYLYRATVTTSKGAQVVKTKKLAVTAK